MKFKIILFLIATSVFFTGCLEVETTISVNPDGSGTITETFLMNKEMIGMMEGFSKSFDDSTRETEEFSLYDEEELISNANSYGDGVKFVKGEQKDINGQKGYTAYYSFDDITKLKIDQNPDDKISMDDGNKVDMEDGSKKYYTFKFNEGNPSELIIESPEIDFEKDAFTFDQPSDTSSGEDAFNMEGMAYFLKDLKISIKVDVNGNITETNATYVDDSEITLVSFVFGSILNNKEKFKELNNYGKEDTGKIKELIKNLDGFDFEIERPVYVKFE